MRRPKVYTVACGCTVEVQTARWLKLCAGCQAEHDEIHQRWAAQRRAFFGVVTDYHQEANHDRTTD